MFFKSYYKIIKGNYLIKAENILWVDVLEIKFKLVIFKGFVFEYVIEILN